VNDAVSSVRSGKTIVIPAVMDKIEVPFSSFTWEKNITSVASGLRKETRAVLNMAAGSGLKSMVHRRGLSEANEVLSELKNGRIMGRAVLVP
jgi:propanol-preferring alcohol dehydrogenase